MGCFDAPSASGINTVSVHAQRSREVKCARLRTLDGSTALESDTCGVRHTSQISVSGVRKYTCQMFWDLI